MRIQRFERLLWIQVLLLSAVLCAGTAEAQSVLGSTEMKSLAPGVKVEILDLKRSPGGTVTLTFALINGTDQKSDVVQKHLKAYNRSDVGKITLVDWENKKRYWAVRDEEGNCLCSNGNYNSHDIASGGRREFWIRFPAPPPEVTKISIDVPGAFPLDDVPISE